MIQSELLGRIRLLAEAYNLPVTARPDPVAELAPVQPVPQVLVLVEQQLANGQFRVSAAGRRIDITLPPSTQPGDRIRLPLTALTAPAETPPDTVEAVRSEVSSTGRFVAELAGQARKDGAPGAIGASRPLLPNAPIDTALAAATLRELVALSGLFYEAHQAEWLDGRRATQELQREPQGKLPALPADKPPSAAAAIHRDAAPIIEQQINALESRQMIWIGQIWPGQTMRWEIGDTEHRAPEVEATERSWQTRIELQLPALGTLSAVLTLDEDRLSVRLRAGSARGNAAAAAGLGELRDALSRAGLRATATMEASNGQA